MKQLTIVFGYTMISIAGVLAQQEAQPNRQITVQEEPMKYSAFLKQFVKRFNDSSYTELVAELSPSFLKSVPEKRLIQFLSGMRNDFGKIQAVKFKYFDPKASVMYHAELEKGWFRIIIGLDDSNKVQRLVFVDPNYNEELPIAENKTPMRLPFDGVWYVFWGGDTESQNYHVSSRAQKNAFDFVMRDSSGRDYRTDGTTNADYFAFGQKILAPCDGEIVMVIDSVHDNTPGKMNPRQLTGNAVVIKAAENEYVLIAHLRHHSIQVHNGDKVRTGQYLGECGNSGNSSEPHLHLHIMDTVSLGQATGIKCFFENLKVNDKIVRRHSPVKGERIERTQ